VINMGLSEVTGTVAAGFELAEAWRTNLAEARQERLSITEDRAVEVRVRPRQLVTVELTPRK
jgi:hypothetical protein